MINKNLLRIAKEHFDSMVEDIPIPSSLQEAFDLLGSRKLSRTLKQKSGRNAYLSKISLNCEEYEISVSEEENKLKGEVEYSLKISKEGHLISFYGNEIRGFMQKISNGSC
ncbi:MAG: hypothetical protein HZB68_03280 [Candidatus Aenigmarchaeota archaeon]|nr:hypothetical protein [Candidatus Aenigmarchaeota archaeon]